MTSPAPSTRTEKVGVMIVGVRGATASTTVAVPSLVEPEGLDPFLLSAAGAAGALPLADPADMVFGGWDPWVESWRGTLTRHGVIDPDRHPGLLESLSAVPVYDPVVLPRDHAAVVGEAPAAAGGVAVVARLREDIRDFRARTGADRVVVVYLAAPALLPPPKAWARDAAGLLAELRAGRFETAAPYYAAAAILEGCPFVDYTASATLEMPGLLDLAALEGVPVAGRDGSTGQTLLKSVLAETFATRRLRILGWYSANILGNHDGFMLGDARYCDVKKVDKTALLEEIVGHPVEHLVDIRYYRPAGDRKEAWDAVDFETVLGGRGELRLNWRCSDSLLAAPAILDLVRLASHAGRIGEAGLQPWLGVFFKHPLGTPERRYLHLARALETWCAHAAGYASPLRSMSMDRASAPGNS